MLNKVQLIGRLGADPEIRYLPSGLPATNFRIATDERWTNGDGEKQSRTEWHRIVTFGKLAETVANFMKKGRLVYLEGRIQTREWTDQNNVKRYTTEIVALSVRFLDKMPEGIGNDADKSPDAVTHEGLNGEAPVPF